LTTITQYYRVDRRRIAFLKFIFEAYDGIAVITTMDASAGTVAIRVAPGCEKEVTTLIKALKQKIRIESVTSVCHDAGENFTLQH
jgi:hypothetical protein